MLCLGREMMMVQLKWRYSSSSRTFSPLFNSPMDDFLRSLLNFALSFPVFVVKQQPPNQSICSTKQQPLFYYVFCIFLKTSFLQGNNNSILARLFANQSMEYNQSV